jgi:3-phenylpropionate/cinnamic acid dioxygenase small subunit
VSAPDAAALARLVRARQAEEFLYREAMLLDAREFEAWLDLLAEDVRYFMPLRRNVPSQDPADEWTREGEDVAWFDEGKDILAMRVAQLRTGVHWAEEPPSRTCHLVSNVLLLDDSGPEWRVHSHFIFYRNRMERETDLLAGRREDRLRVTPAGLRLAHRRVLLEHNVLEIKNLTNFF